MGYTLHTVLGEGGFFPLFILVILGAKLPSLRSKPRFMRRLRVGWGTAGWREKHESEVESYTSWSLKKSTGKYSAEY